MSKYGLPAKIVEVENHVGHWKVGTGASSLVDEVRESRKIASRVHAILTADKVPSTYFQDDISTNKNQNLTTLVKHHNADENGLVVSWHLNAVGPVTQSGIGTEVLYANEKWKPLAEALSAAIAKAGNFKNRGAKLRKDLYVLNSTKEPSILVETFFVNSTADVAMYNRHFEDICQAAAKVLADAVGKTINKAPAPVDPVINTNLKFSSQALTTKVNAIISDRDKQRELIIKAIAAGAINDSWLAKFDNKTLEANDFFGLAVLHLATQ